MGIYLGLDGGGTKTAACLLDEGRVELGRGLGGPCNIATGSLESLRESIVGATRRALESAGLPPATRFEAVCAGVAGYTAKRRRAEFRRLLAETIPAARHRLEPDFVIAWWGATEGEPGIIVSAGTGAVVYGRNEKGESRREDGRGFLLGDRGSGFYMGRFALKRTLNLLDADRPLMPFHKNILRAVGAEDADDLIEWVYRDFSPARVAGLAAVIGQMAAEGDEQASMLVASAGQSLRISFGKVRRKLNMPESTPAYVLGSLWSIGEPLLGGFHRGFDQAPPPPLIEIRHPSNDAAYGAAFLAMQADVDA